MRRLLAAGAALLTLAGCSGSGLGMAGSPAWFATTPVKEQVAYFRSRCEAYGFKAGTDAMAQCVQNESNSSHNRASRRSSAAMAALANSGPKTTTCNTYGSMTNCTTF